MIQYIKGDIFIPFDKGQYNVLMHGCNCFCQMGAGIAKAIKRKYPWVYKKDCQTKRGDKHKLGTIEPVLVGDVRYIVNAYTQYDYRGKGVNADYRAIKSCFSKLHNFAITNSYKVCIPKIGAGLAGGDWCAIEGIINDIFKDYPIDVYYL